MALETEAVALDSEMCRRGVEAVFADPSLGRYFVVERGEAASGSPGNPDSEKSTGGGLIVGSLMITYEWSDWRCGTVWWIQSVYVTPEIRGKGAYRLMYETVRAIVEADASLRGIRLYVDRRNQSAQKVYERLGMNGEHYQLYEWMN